MGCAEDKTALGIEGKKTLWSRSYPDTEEADAGSSYVTSKGETTLPTIELASKLIPGPDSFPAPVTVPGPGSSLGIILV